MTPEERRAYHREYYKTWTPPNPEEYARKNRERQREYRKNYPDKAEAAVKAAKRKKPDKYRLLDNERKRRRRAKRLKLPFGDLGEIGEYRHVLLCDPCSYCGGEASEVDHIDALAQGGNHDWDNFTAACRTCNQRKGTKSLLEGLLYVTSR